MSCESESTDVCFGCEGIWKPETKGNIPANAVSGGIDDSEELYIARVRLGDDLIPGKLHPSHRTCYVAYGGGEFSNQKYEVLCETSGKWMPWSGKIPENAVIGGYSSVDCETLFIGRAANTIGKVHPSHGTCYTPYGGEEKPHKEFEIFVCDRE